MIISLDSKRVAVGMFIILPDSLLENPFWKNKFEVKTEKQIKKLLKAGIKEVKVDTEKSKIDIDSNEAVEIVKAHGLEVNKDENGYSLVATEEPGKEEVKSPNIEVKDVQMPKKEEFVPTEKWEPEKFMSPELVSAVKDTSLPPEKRAQVVVEYSTEMMKSLLAIPTAANIAATKVGVSEMVDILVNEDSTSSNLLKLVSHDYYTYTHSVNVGVKSVLLVKEFYGDSGTHDVHELGAGFFLHDIGKVNVSADIINKPGKLTEEEFTEMRKHPDESEKILSEAHQLTEEARVIATQHHERDDGRGYPKGLKGYDIHPYASICCLADVYDALTGKRSYKVGKTPELALKIMVEEMSGHFNGEMMSKFIEMFKKNGVIN